MSWKLILQLSMFGLAMAIATVFWIPMTMEPVFWLIIFIICAYIIAKKSQGYLFLHGFLVSIVNSVWITGIHFIFYDNYIMNHPEIAQMNDNSPISLSPKYLMLILGPFFGAISGIILGFFSVIGGRIVKRQDPLL